MKNFIQKTFGIALTIALALAPLAPDLRSLAVPDRSLWRSWGEVGPVAEAASFVNVAVPSNTNLTSGLLLFYSFDNTKFSTTTVTDESGNGKTGTPSVARAATGGSSVNVEALVVGGGGGGGVQQDGAGGGGGAGGYQYNSSYAVTAQAYTITVGGGGSGSTGTTVVGGTGSDSVFGSITANGGGGGGSSSAHSTSGGSGGGGAGENTGTNYAGSSGTQGSAGGAGDYTAGSRGGGGGGGAGGVGADANTGSDNAGNGGIGIQNSISGSATYYAGGGGGGKQPATGTTGTGGLGGGGNGSIAQNNAAQNGSPNTGGGGGGSDATGGSAGNGGSGIVIISATTGVITSATGGTFTQSGGKDIWTFTADGTWTPTIPASSAATAAPLKVPGKIGQAIKFNGITASTTVGNVSSSVKTVAFWAKVATSTASQSIMDLNGAGANIRLVNGVVTANGFTSPTIYVDGAVSSTLNNTNWHHVVITTGTNVNASNVNLGVASSTYYGGTLDDLRMYNRALSVSEVKRLYQLGATSYVNIAVPSNTNNASGLVLQYTFDNTKFSTTTVTDESGNGKTGTPSVARVAGSSSANVEALVVGGGGGGGGAGNGAAAGGGGGAGGFIYNSSFAVTAQAYTITVGAGGNGGIARTPGTNGATSTFSTINASGGGGGGAADGVNGKAGGSGGGGSGGSGTGGTGNVIVTTPSQGNNGGNGGAGDVATAGGGGASAAGGSASGSQAGSGGDGTANSISGASVTYAGGGGGGTRDDTNLPGSGGAGGGGAGGQVANSWDGYNGTANRGGGGGGGGRNISPVDVGVGGNGGSGIVIISAPTGTITSATGCTQSASGGNDIWTCNSSDTWTPTIPASSAATAAPLKVPGKIGQAIKFNGITASTTVGNVSSSVKTVAFWTKVSTSTVSQSVMDLNGAGTNIRLVNGVVTANGFTSPTIYVDGAVSSTLNNTNWHHVVITTGTNVNASNVNLGVASSTYYGGTLDDLRMYNRALSVSEVKRLYQLGATSYVNIAVPSNTRNSSGLVLQYSFDSTKFSTTTVTDESGNGKTGTPSVARAGATAAPLKVPGKIGSAIKFDGINASTTVGNVSASVKTVAFWAKVATSTTQQNIIDLNGSGANIEIVNGVVTANGFTSPTIYVDGAVSSTLNNRNWHHVVVTTGTNVNASNLSLGVASSTYFGGTLDDLRMYNRALSAAEAKRLYQLGN